ncbi:MAG: hypothetical protein ACJA13_002786 [Paraglaciecola sp.]|jgi:hypothetical protein
MKQLKKIGVVAALVFASVGFTSFSANAAVIMQDVFIDIDRADTGNAWGIILADSGLFGTIQYDPTKVVIGGTITPEDDRFYTFSFALAGLAFTAMDDWDFGFGGPLAYTDPADFFSGVTGIDFQAADYMYSINGANFNADDGDTHVVSGLLTFGQTQLVSEPSVLIMMLGGLVLITRRKFTA